MIENYIEATQEADLFICCGHCGNNYYTSTAKVNPFLGFISAGARMTA